jgi:hypothetical protein
VQSLIKTQIEFADIEGIPTEKVFDDRPARSTSSADSAKGGRGSRPRRSSPSPKDEAITVAAQVQTDSDASAVDPAEVLETFAQEMPPRRRERGGRGRRRPDAAPVADPLAVIDLGEGEQNAAPSGFDASPEDIRPREPRQRRDRPERTPRDTDRGGRDRYDRTDRDPVVLAFGDDVPAFMKIPTINRP